MANQKILEKKQDIINEIAEKTKNSSSVVIFEYQGLTVEDTNRLRRLLKENNSEFKIYKNTLAKRAFDSLKIEMSEEFKGPKAIAFSEDSIAPIKVLYDFIKSLGRDIFMEDEHHHFSLLQTFPYKLFDEIQDNTLEQEGLFPNSVLQIKETD